MEIQLIQTKIHLLREQRVMLDFDLAALYEVPTKALNQAVKRNLDRFPKDFMFQLTEEEWKYARSEVIDSNEPMWSQIVTTSKKFRRESYIPFAFTEQGVAMLSSVLRSEKAIQVNISIMRAFIEMRHYMLSYTALAQKISEIESRWGKEISDIQEVLRWLGEENQARANELTALEPASSVWENRRPIGFSKED